MKTLHVDHAARLASPRRRPSRLDTVDILAWSSRLGAVALVSYVGWIHLHLWLDGYRRIPTIGPLFLAGAATAFVVAAGLLLWPSRLLGLMGLAIDLGILAALAVSINVGLFGFRESLSAPLVGESIIVELLAAAALISWVAVDYAADKREARSVPAHDTGLEQDQEQVWKRRADDAELHADALARALEFHVVNECDCHGASDMAALRRHEIRRLRRTGAGDRPDRPATNAASYRAAG